MTSTLGIVAAVIAAVVATVMALKTDVQPYDEPGDNHRRIPPLQKRN